MHAAAEYRVRGLKQQDDRPPGTQAQPEQQMCAQSLSASANNDDYPYSEHQERCAHESAQPSTGQQEDECPSRLDNGEGRAYNVEKANQPPAPRWSEIRLTQHRGVERSCGGGVALLRSVAKHVFLTPRM